MQRPDNPRQLARYFLQIKGLGDRDDRVFALNFAQA
jgi:hypothetical protein